MPDDRDDPARDPQHDPQHDPEHDPDRDESLDTATSGPTELRVHGVSGTPPEQSLDHPLLRRVAGDGHAGFYRRWYPGGRSADLRALRQPDGRRLEAYSWGGLTSGGATRAVWLLMLPFMLANLAHWMLPAVPDESRRVRVLAAHASAGLLRVFGLALTLTLVLTGAQVGIDVVLWQCGGDPRCVEQTRVLGPFVSGVLESPGRRVVVGAVLPLLLVAVVGLLGRSSARGSLPAPDVPVSRRSDEPLARAAFWQGNPGLVVLRTSHVAAATASLAALVAWPATSLVATGGARVLGLVVCWAALAVLAACVVLVARGVATGREAAPGAHGPLSAAGAAWLRRGASALLVIAAVYSAWDWGDSWDPSGRLPALRTAVHGSFAATVVVLVVLGVTVAVQRPWGQSTSAGFRPAMAGFAAPATATLAFLAAGGFSAGLTFRVAELFGRPVLSQRTRLLDLYARESVIADPGRTFAERLAAAQEDAPLVVPPSFAWAGAATTVITVVVLVSLVAIALRVRRQVGPLADAVLAARPDEVAGRTSADAAVRRVALTVALAALGDDIGKVLGRLVAASGVVLLAGAVFYAAAQDNWRVIEVPPLSTITSIGTWLMGLYVIGTLAIFWASYRNPTMRRYVGVLWDVGCFWPRAAHPLSPPSYGERAVPQLAERTTLLARDGSVLLSGHSQGSVLAAVAVLQLPPGAASGVSLLTHGSPLRRLYARFFPAYLGEKTIKQVERSVGGRWRNLYRDTDPIGSWVLDGSGQPSAVVDRYVADPRTLGGPIDGHMDYWTADTYAGTAAELTAPASGAAPASLQ